MASDTETKRVLKLDFRLNDDGPSFVADGVYGDGALRITRRIIFKPIVSLDVIKRVVTAVGRKGFDIRDDEGTWDGSLWLLDREEGTLSMRVNEDEFEIATWEEYTREMLNHTSMHFWSGESDLKFISPLEAADLEIVIPSPMIRESK